MFRFILISVLSLLPFLSFLFCQNYTYGFVIGDTAQLVYSDSLSFRIQWQEREAQDKPWRNITGASQSSLQLVYSTLTDTIKYYRARVNYLNDPCTYYSTAVKHHIAPTLNSLQVTDYYQGGLIFYVQDSMGLVIAPYKDGRDPVWYGNQGYTSFGCFNIAIPEARNTEIGAGESNTKALIKACGSDAKAAYLCDTLVLNGFSNWFLPSKEEMELAFEIQKNPMTPIMYGDSYAATFTYWTSSELDAEQAYRHNIYVNSSFSNKSKEFWVRAARKLVRNKPFKNTFNFSASNLSSCPFDIHIAQSDKSTSIAIVKFVGDTSLASLLIWDFEQGKILSGQGAGPYEIYYNYEGFNQVTARLKNDSCDVNKFISPYFKVQLFHELPQYFYTNYKGQLKLADYDKDGFKDILVTGYDSSSLYRYVGNDTFEFVQIALPRLSLSTALWLDFNLDGWTDFILSGLQLEDSTCRTFVYQNNHGVFELMQVSLPGIQEGFMETVDLDQDGSLELLIGGESNHGVILGKIFRIINGNFIESDQAFPALKRSSCSIADYDRDGDADLILTGHDGKQRLTRLFNNDQGSLKDSGHRFIDVDDGNAKFGDYDNDGWEDIAINGNIGDISINYNEFENLSVDARLAASFKIYKNRSGQSFENRVSYEKWPAYCHSTLDWGDYDNDGDLDLLMHGHIGFHWGSSSVGGGKPPFVARSAPRIYKNEGQDRFLSIDADLPSDFADFGRADGFKIATEAQNLRPTWSLLGWQGKYAAFVDYNKDGKLDVLREGHYEQANKMYKNCNLTENLPPLAPINLLAMIQCYEATLSWNASLDDHTPEVCMKYEIYVGRSAGSYDLISPLNNQNLTENFYSLHHLQAGTYYWSVKAVDQAQSESTWSAEKSFVIYDKPQTPVITSIGNTLISSAEHGNQWYDDQGAIQGATKQEYIVNASGRYYCIVTQHGCSSDSSNHLNLIISGLDSGKGLNIFQIMPNPVSNTLTISLKDQEKPIQLKLCDPYGKILVFGSFRNKEVLDMSYLKSGNYFLTLSFESATQVFKIAKM